MTSSVTMSVPPNTMSTAMSCVCHRMHGSAYFWEWRDEGDHYIVPADSRAFYEGARNALNAVWGITFPSCEVTQVQSTIGHFETLYDYEQARRLCLPFMKNVERFLAAQHNSSDSSGGCLCEGIGQERVNQAGSWLKRATAAISTVIDLENCGNPIGIDGGRGWMRINDQQRPSLAV